MWQRLELVGRAVEVFTPSERPRFVMVFLADIEGTTLRDNDTWTNLLRTHEAACVVPDGGASWWLAKADPAFHSTYAPEEWLLQELLPWIDQRWGTKLVPLVGVGMGGQGVIRMGLRHPQQFSIVASVQAYLDFHEAYGSGSSLDTLFESRELCRLATPVLQIQGAKWPTHLWMSCDPNSAWFRGHERFTSKLTALGVNYTADFESCTCGHTWNYYDFMAPRVLRFVSEAWAKESRRLL